MSAGRKKSPSSRKKRSIQRTKSGLDDQSFDEWDPQMRQLVFHELCKQIQKHGHILCEKGKHSIDMFKYVYFSSDLKWYCENHRSFAAKKCCVDTVKKILEFCQASSEPKFQQKYGLLSGGEVNPKPIAKALFDAVYIHAEQYAQKRPLMDYRLQEEIHKAVLEREEFLGSRIIVIDNGSRWSKNGYSGERLPRSVWPTVVGYPPSNVKMTPFYVGFEAIEKRANLELVYPVVDGYIRDWDAMENLWNYTFHEDLGVLPNEHPVILTEPVFSFMSHREHMAEIFFETFQVPEFYVSSTATLALYSSGRTTGLVVDSGYDATYVVPIYEGFPITHAIRRVDLAGRNITEYLLNLLRKKGYPMEGEERKEIVEKAKQHLCYISLDPDKEVTTEVDFRLPWGEIIKFGSEKFQAPELLFDPQLLSIDSLPLDEQIVGSIKDCVVDLRKDLFANVVLSGGTTAIPGFKERLQKELAELVPESTIRIFAPDDRQFSVWIGGSVITSLKAFQKMWVSRKDYFDEGVEVIHRCI